VSSKFIERVLTREELVEDVRVVGGRVRQQKALGYDAEVDAHSVSHRDGSIAGAVILRLGMSSLQHDDETLGLQIDAADMLDLQRGRHPRALAQRPRQFQQWSAVDVRGLEGGGQLDCRIGQGERDRLEDSDTRFPRQP
jgi:hypothetical protein